MLQSLLYFRVSIDNHTLTMISSDGYRFSNTTVQSFIISPGERFDFIVTGDQPDGCYYIRAQTLEVEKTHMAKAILSYNGTSTTVS